MTGTELFCWGCAGRGVVNRVTAGIRCTCGSQDVDLWVNSTEQRGRIASLGLLLEPDEQDPFLFAAYMVKHSIPVGTEIPGWNEYTGPGPSANPMHNGFPPGDVVCSECHGSGIDIQDGGPCRACGTDGKRTPPTSVTPPPAVARHEGPSTQTKVPFVGKKLQAGRKSSDPMGSVEEHIRATTPDWSAQTTIAPPSHPEIPFGWEDLSTHYPRADTYSPHHRTYEPKQYVHEMKKPFVMPGTECPNCGHSPTHLVKDHKEDAHWACPNCGPLANVDANPEVDPYNPPAGFTPMDPKKFKAAKKLFKGRKTGQLMARIAVIAEVSPGLTRREIVGLARESVQRYAEAR